MVSVAQAEELAHLLRAAARAEIMPRFRRLGGDAVRAKSGPLDLVTEADEAAETLITASLTRLFPGAVVVGEEAASRDPGLIGRLADADLAFVVDPIDGTANYVAGLPLFGVMAAAVSRGEVIAAVIHDPVIDDSAIAVRGEGAWTLSATGERADLRVAAPVPVTAMTGAVSWRFMPPPLRGTVLRHLDRVALSWDHRCAAHQYRSLVAGHCHYLVFYRLMPWDHLPGLLLHREAGGYAAHFDGSPHRPADTTGGLIAAPDRDSWEALRAALLDADLEGQ
ncbi:MAG TPA: inositol monophosphatase family protein [Acetobacteraceae bacterium]|nr:inositol monophosphatase family protein [Acetobacteraceae bacterium]